MLRVLFSPSKRQRRNRVRRTQPRTERGRLFRLEPKAEISKYVFLRNHGKRRRRKTTTDFGSSTEVLSRRHSPASTNPRERDLRRTVVAKRSGDSVRFDDNRDDQRRREHGVPLLLFTVDFARSIHPNNVASFRRDPRHLCPRKSVAERSFPPGNRVRERVDENDE